MYQINPIIVTHKLTHLFRIRKPMVRFLEDLNKVRIRVISNTQPLISNSSNTLNSRNSRNSRGNSNKKYSKVLIIILGSKPKTWPNGLNIRSLIYGSELRETHLFTGYNLGIFLEVNVTNLCYRSLLLLKLVISIQ